MICLSGSPENTSQSIEVFLNYGRFPDPDKMIYRDKITLPSTSFEHEFSLRECKTENECIGLEFDDPDRENADQWGIQIPQAGEIDFCFHDFGDNCQVVVAMRLNEIEPEKAAKVQVESANAGCRVLGNDKQNWDRQSCKVSKSTTLDSTICKCNTDGTSSFSVTSDLFVPPRKLDFDSI